MDLGKKMISVEQALSLVKSNDHIVSALAPAEGAAFLGSLHTIERTSPLQAVCRWEILNT